MTHKKLLLGAGVAVVIIIATLLLWPKHSVAPGPEASSSVSATPVARPDGQNTTYSIEGTDIPMRGGSSTLQEAPGVFVRYEYFMQSEGLLNEDEVSDAGVILTADPGGSGTFYYVAAVVSTQKGWKGTNAILLGDRIAPQTVDVARDAITVNYADRKPGEPFTTQPSVGVTRTFQVRNGVLVEVKK